MATGKFKIALLVDRPQEAFPAVAAVARRLQQDPQVELMLAPLPPSQGPAEAQGGPPHNGATSKLLERIGKAEAQILPRARAARRRRAPLPSLPSCELAAPQGEPSKADPSLDLILDLSRSAPPRLARLARHGMWRLGPPRAAEGAGGPIGFWDIRARNGVSEIVLARIGADGREEAAARAFFQTRKSFSENRDFLAEKSAALVQREVRRLLVGAASQAEPGVTGASGVQAAASTPSRITNADLLAYLGAVGRNYGMMTYKHARRFARMRYNSWSLFVGEGDFLSADLAKLREIRPTAGEYWADPFLYRAKGDDGIYIFYESFVYETRKGKLCVGRLGPDGGFSYLGDVMGGGDHLSFPFVMEHEGRLLMIPETSSRRRLEVWECVDFPLRWEMRHTALEGTNCADSSIVEVDGQWWLFTNMGTDTFNDHNSELHVFQIDSPELKELVPHAWNPVVVDARLARNGGRVSRRSGRLLRFAQDNSFSYGSALSIMEVTELSPKTYSERLLRRIEPDFAPGINGCHHLDYSGETFVIDGLREYG
ncbi:glucosamine inositolphosphorylceramide transferase family protein [Afifella pfennigii]|uniref:glucosamine inositolphosphorylceramide transferase family protein n=1 Tax=Afifella pfennigii TaxID=209897 RepID=UPI0012EB5E07|nr:hypothetical protein [Afifella pfennigii]